MKLRITRETLLPALRFVSQALSRNQIHPALGAIRFAVADGLLELSAFDGYTYAERKQLPKEIEDENWAKIRGADLAGFVSQADSDDVGLDTGSGEAEFVCGGFNVRIPIIHEAGPVFQMQDVKGEVTLPLEALGNILHKASLGARTSREENYRGFAANSVSIWTQDGRLYAAGMCETRFAVAHAKSLGDMERKMLPCQSTKGITSLPGPDVTIRTDGSWIEFSSGRSRYATLASGGRQPSDLFAMIPKGRDVPAAMNREELIRKLKIVSSVISRQESCFVDLALSDKGVLSARSKLKGSISAEISTTYDGRPMGIAFLPEFMLAALNEMPEDEVVLYLDQAIVVETKGFIYVQSRRAEPGHAQPDEKGPE